LGGLRAYLSAKEVLMGAGSGFPVDLILLGMVAAFLVLRLRSVLGRRSGYERPAQSYQPTASGPRPGPIIEATAEAAPAAQNRAMPEPASALGQKLTEFTRIDPNFSAPVFLDGAERAFHLIVRAFAAGDRAALAGLLTERTAQAFETVIAQREAAGHTQVNEVRSLQRSAIQAAELTGSVGAISVQFVSDQVNFTRDRDGQMVVGTDAVTEITDVWTFERDLANRDPTWRLAAAGGA
jgi:predicted lipid-binding transport protein (Tim44 family)